MRASRTLSVHLLVEVVQYMALGFLAFSTILITQNLLRRLEDLVAVGFRAEDVLGVLAALLPMLAAYALPVAFLFGVLLTVGRLSSDSEVTAMRACGMGIGALLLPVVALSLLVGVGTAWLMVHSEPRARIELRNVLRSAAARGAILEPGKFRVIGERVVYVRDRDTENRLRGILIADRSDPDRPFLVFAERGVFVVESGQARIQLHLEDGDVHVEPREPGQDRYQRISFQKFEYAFDAPGIFSSSPAEMRPSDMTMEQLSEVLARAAAGDPLADLHDKDPVEYALQYHRRLALPVAPVLFALVGVPLGLRRVRGARSWGALLCVAVVFLYYALLSLAQFLAQSIHVPPWAALWLPNLAFLALSIPLLRRAQRGEI
ncbi:MAG TPA: LptF/LptG family permease [Myxococcota bacterium]|jgi:lipopolysaccharide export system permease protein|nr:LptF/LptG family permease [Myxococcota bacterium]